MRFVFFAVILILVHPLYAGTVRLVNNSHFDLRAVVRGADGTFLSEVVVHAQNIANWTDSYHAAGAYEGPPPGQEQSGYQSKTPYTVIWSCMDGSDYSVCDGVATGATVTALGCPGARACRPPPPPKKPGQSEQKPQ
jgi:hypothetical protein